MDFLEEIKVLDDNELEKVVREKIKRLEEEATDDTHTIGYHLNYNPEDYSVISNLDDDLSFSFGVSCYYGGYIRRNIKMVYGFCFDLNGIVSNDGNYYYVDTDDYVLEFCKFIKDKEVASEYDLFDYVLEFIRKYLGTINNRNRSEMFQMLYKDDRQYYDPVMEHGFSWFKGQGNGMCTEYSLMAQNILSMFDIDCSIVIGRIETDGEKGENHAFNLISFDEMESGEEVNYLIDFGNCCKIFDENFKLIDYTPFIAPLDSYDDEFVDELINKNKHLVFEDYDYIVLGDSFIMVTYDKNREYFIPSDIFANGERRDYDDGLQYNKTIS